MINDGLPDFRVRKRQNWNLYRKVYEPLEALRNTEHDPWSYDPETFTFIYTTNPVWEAAVIESNRRWDLYEQLKPF